VFDTRVPTKSIRLAKSLIARGCEITKMKFSSTGSCYLSARLLTAKFTIRISDHYGRTPAPNRNLYYVRVDDPAKGTSEPIGSFIRRHMLSR